MDRRYSLEADIFASYVYIILKHREFGIYLIADGETTITNMYIILVGNQTPGIRRG